jgi:hypothetical protein
VVLIACMHLSLSLRVYVCVEALFSLNDALNQNNIMNLWFLACSAGKKNGVRLVDEIVLGERK